MQRQIMAGLLLASSLITTANAEVRWLSTMPPADYDVQYKGILTITRVQSEEDIREICAVPAQQIRASACAKRSHTASPNQPAPYCRIFVVTDKILKSMGATWEFTLRHELAHCNGWPADHPNGKKALVSTRMKMPTLPEGTQWLTEYDVLKERYQSNTFLKPNPNKNAAAVSPEEPVKDKAATDEEAERIKTQLVARTYKRCLLENEKSKTIFTQTEIDNYCGCWSALINDRVPEAEWKADTAAGTWVTNPKKIETVKYCRDKYMPLPDVTEIRKRNW
jgi:hypothetical protein